MVGIFLSYSRADRDDAFRIVQGLRALGVEVWWDEDMPGVDWQYELEQRINDMAAVLVLWSKNSQGSKNVRDEARLADKRDKLINAMVGVKEPPFPFDRYTALPIDGWSGHEPHNGWARVVETAELFLVAAGDTEPGAVVAKLTKADQDWRDRRQALAEAQDAFGEAQLAVGPADEAATAAAAELGKAQEHLAKIVALDLPLEIIDTAKSLCDAKAVQKAAADDASRAAKARLTEAARMLKVRQSAVDAPAQELPPPTTPLQGRAQEGRKAGSGQPDNEKQRLAAIRRREAEANVVRKREEAARAERLRLEAEAKARSEQKRPDRWANFKSQVLALNNATRGVIVIALVVAIGIGLLALQPAGFYRLAAGLGDPAAQFNLALMYSKGDGGLDVDKAEAVRLYRLAADQGNPSAQNNLGVMYEYGVGGLAVDKAEAVRLYRLAADQGNATAQNNLGIMYEYGEGGLAVDKAEAVHLYRLAADQGDASARNNLGTMYNAGEGGLTVDKAEALRLFRLAADQGFASAQFNLAWMYDNGEGGLAVDKAEAVRLYRLAADQGNATAQNNLGIMYEYGVGGLAVDKAEAVRLYRLAARQGNAKAADNLAKLGEKP